jgi:hypothetical protein
VTLFRIERDAEGFRRATVASAEVRFYKEEYLRSLGIPQVWDFFEARPRYHRYPSLNFEKTYTEEENNKLVEFVMAQKSITEGEEHE